jgi:ADP-heptose:LPS heptosyltransferase
MPFRNFFKLFRPNSILLIRKRGLGDVVWMEPVIRALAGKYKHVQVFTLFDSVFENYPLKNVEFRNKLSFLEKVVVRIERFLGTRFFTISLDMSYEIWPKMHILNAYQKRAGRPFTKDYPKLYLSTAESNTFFLDKPYVILHIETLAGKNYRNVYGVNWQQVVDYLHAKGYGVVEIGKEQSVQGAAYFKTDIRGMMSLIANASFFIGLDSGPSHIAAAFGVPAILFFGAVNPEYRHFKELFKGYILQEYCEFAGCYHEHKHIGTITCRVVGDEGIPPCSLHSTGMVLDSINKLIAKYSHNYADKTT